MSTNASFCSNAPHDGEIVIETAMGKYAGGDNCAVDGIISTFPDAEAVKEYIHNTLNGSGSVVIEYDDNATNWSIRELDSEKELMTTHEEADEDKKRANEAA